MIFSPWAFCFFESAETLCEYWRFLKLVARTGIEPVFQNFNWVAPLKPINMYNNCEHEIIS